MLRGLADRWSRGPRRPGAGRRDRPVMALPSVALRAAIMVGVAVVVLGIILFRLWFLQILSGQEFLAEANNNRLRSVKIVAPRGAIQDRRGRVIVDNRPGLAVGIRRMDVTEDELPDLVRRLAKVLRLPARKVQSRLDQHSGYPYDLVIIEDDVSRKVVSYLLEHKMSFPGVEIQKSYLRAYPSGDLAAHILGNLGEITAEQLAARRYKGYAAGDVIGQGGLEWTYDRWLRGRDGVSRIEVDAFGQPKSHESAGSRLPEPGNTLVTTIDAKVQAKTEEALRYGITLARTGGQVEANGGSALVLDARNGQVVAMASYPTFEPRVWVGGISTKAYKKLADPRANHPLLNRAIQESKAVGSTFKVIDAVAALEEGVVTTSTAHYCDGSYVAPNTSDNQVFNCWARSGHGSVNLAQAISQSCDIYFYNVGYSFYLRKGTELADWAVRLGMGVPTGIDVPGEVAGRVPTPDWKRSYFKSEVDKIWNPGDSILLSIGQGNLEATPLQLAVTYAAIANGGTIVTPHLGLKVVDPQGGLVRNVEPAGRRRIDISEGTLEAVRAGLRQAASAGTSGPVFAGYPVAVAGKTGTAEVWDSTRSGYVDYAWYASYAPADNPRYVTVVMIEKGGHGGSTAAPATRLIYDQLFRVKGSAPISSGYSD